MSGLLHGINLLSRLSDTAPAFCEKTPKLAHRAHDNFVDHGAGLTSNYCDDFVCTSSPAVEQNLRALARDLTRLNTWTISLFA